MTLLNPYTLKIDNDVITDIYERISSFPWKNLIEVEGWEYGTDPSYMKELCDYWINQFNWREQESKINKFNNFKTSINNIETHFIYEKGSGDSSTPLIMNHGWPGSIVEFLDIIEPLAHPERFGGDINDSFDVIVPSLPGFGFSGPISRAYGPREIASIFNILMTERLDYKSYMAQGGDWGSAVASWLGFNHANNCKAIHLNCLTIRHVDGPKGKTEIEWNKLFEKEQLLENGYRTQNATKPQTLSYAMIDSPVGVAAWIVEKFRTWSDCKGDIESRFTKDEILTNIMIYLVTGTFQTASWIYYGRRIEGQTTAAASIILSQKGKRVEIPTGCAVFPKEFLRWAPRSYVERIYNVTSWTEMNSGGHFAAMEEPKMLIQDIRNFAKNNFSK